MFLMEVTAALLAEPENFNVGIDSDIYESIQFKLGMVID